jgi:hypothetical protein
MLLTAFLVCALSDSWMLIDEPSWIRRRKNTTPSVTLFQVIRNTLVLFILFMGGPRVLLARGREAVVGPPLGALPLP